MLKKLLTNTMMLLAMSPVAAGILSSTTVSADTASFNTVVKPQPREIHARFTGELRGGMGVQPVMLGTVEYVIPNGIMLDVVNGGPESLSWSASVINGRTGKQISAWKEFKHGTSNLSLPIDKTQVHLGDKLVLYLHANSGSGYVTLIAG
jgi:hypothetical protein